MLRQSFRRCAGMAGRASPSALVAGRRLVAPTVQRTAAALSRSSIPMQGKFSRIMMYSTEATALETEAIELPNAEEVTAFADLSQVHPNLLEAITKDMGYDTMTPVQAKTINPALKGTDIVAQAKTGTGKTLAFLLPLLQRMIEEDPTLATRRASRNARSDDIRGIILSPTRELAEQIAAEARRLTKHTGLVVQSAVGGTQKSAMLRQTRRQGCHLLVATPGRLNDLLQDKSSGIDAPNLAALVLDEADRMLDVGFEKELEDIIRCLPGRDEKVRQTILVSATIPDDVIRLARSMVRADDFEFVQTIPENESLTHDRVPQHVLPVASWANVFPSLFELIDREVEKARSDESVPEFKAIVYFNTTALVEMAEELGYQRRRNGQMKLSTFSIQSKLTQQQRSKAAERFRNARSGVLFSSDVTARGMDFPNVTHVVQIDVPRDRESYIHRLGRTARQDKNGEGWMMLPPASVVTARKLLRGLPLQQNKSIESASVEIDSDNLTNYHQELLDLSQTLNKKLLGAAYTSVFGTVTRNKEELVDDLNNWAVKGWGWSEPPPVSASWARNLGLQHTVLNIQDRPRRDDRFDRDDDRRPRRFDGDSDRGRGRSSDPFADMGRRVRRDDRGGSNRDFGRQRGGGGGGGGRGRFESKSSW